MQARQLIGIVDVPEVGLGERGGRAGTAHAALGHGVGVIALSLDPIGRSEARIDQRP